MDDNILILANTSNSVIRVTALSGKGVTIQELSVEHGAHEITLSAEVVGILWCMMREKRYDTHRD